MRTIHQLAVATVSVITTLTGLPLRADTIEGVPVTVLSRTPVTEGGRVITYTRIRPPALPPKPVPPANPAVEPTAAELAESARLAAMQYGFFEASVTVHLRPPIVSAFRWRTDEREWLVWANVDARLLASVWQWENATTIYSWFPMIDEIGGEDDSRPANLGLSPGPAEYVFEASAAELAANETQFAALDTLLAYHDLHRAALAAAFTRREALTAEAERLAALPKPKPKDETIYFWKIETPAPAAPVSPSLAP
jgi:hypothetical protein